MKKSIRKKNVLKEAGVLPVTAILVLVAVVAVPMLVQRQAHDVGVTEIISPTTGPMQSYTPEVTVKNFGTNVENSVPVEMVIEKDGVTDYYQIVFISTINPGQSLSVTFPVWYPSDIGKFNVTACTQLSGDENADNDCLTKTFYITMDFMGFGVAPLGNAELAIVNESLEVSNCISGENETDGAWVNLEDIGNWYTTWLEFPSVNSSLLTIKILCENSSMIRGEPVPGAEIFIEQEPSEKPIFRMGTPNTGAEKATVEAFNGTNLVFYKKDIPLEKERVYVGYVNRKITYLGTGVSKFERGDITGYKVVCNFPYPVPWCWSEQGVNNLLVTKIELVTEHQGRNETPPTHAQFYSKDIEKFNMKQMYAGVNNPPSTPTIDGPASGKINIKYDYKIRNTDIEPLYYFVDWGDGSDINFVGPYAPGTEATVSHTWTVKGTYTIRVKAMDEQYFESDWATLKVIMPKARMINQPVPLTKLLLERFPNMFPILSYLLGL